MISLILPRLSSQDSGNDLELFMFYLYLSYTKITLRFTY